MQRFLNGMHILALLAAIYMMIFVVEPVAVPPSFLSQHYYGLPWGADRRTHRDFANLPLLRQTNLHASINRDDKINQGPLKTRLRPGLPLLLPTASNQVSGVQLPGVQTKPQRPGFPLLLPTASSKVSGAQQPPLYFHNKNANMNREKPKLNFDISINSENPELNFDIGKSTVANLTSTTKVRYLSVEDLHKRRNTTSPVHSKVQPWSKWIPPQNAIGASAAPEKVQNKSDWRPSITVITKNDSNVANKELYVSTGSAESLSLSELGK